MAKLSLFLQTMHVFIFLLAHPNRGVRLYPVLQEGNNSLQQDMVYSLAKRKLPSLKSNSLEAKFSGQGNNSSGVLYYATHDLWGGPDASYYGLRVTTDVYSHELKRGQLTRSGIWVGHSGDGRKSSYNGVSVGWHIAPEKYGDSHPHLFTYWTRDGYESTGCYNMDCPGFIAASGATVTPGARINPSSKVTLRVLKDDQSGHWWVYYGFNSVPTVVGYYPQSLFTYMAKKANQFSFGGFVFAERALPTPPLGSGVLPGGKGRAASFTDLRLIERDGRSSPIMKDLPTVISNNKCYSITPIVNSGCFYGGPGGCV
ncbi:uncharacterized protein LOC119367381 [Triticum dicoccoides]|uniref:uncharacterized protein LOC119367381 n=1 Tax=Triticum dicoccoides TaxID=85692 RepID=UPI00188ECC72|nr:uncharacterized protein LOC119367381 [Triticum dicoccoides]